MNLNFDVISDLHLESMDGIDWENKATSLYCIVAGNISSDHAVVYKFLDHIRHFYKAVFFIDGTLEHKQFRGNYADSYTSLRLTIETIEGVFFLHENIIVLENVIIMGINGWTSFNFTDVDLIESNINFLVHKERMTEEQAKKVYKMAVSDRGYLYNSIVQAQEFKEVTDVVIVTNCVPRIELIENDSDFKDTIEGDLVGSLGIHECLTMDSGHLVSTWIFGRYPNEVDETIENVRYLSNPALYKDFDIYYPKILKF